MITKNRVDTERRAKMREYGRDGLRRNELPAFHTLNDEISEEHDDVRTAGIHAGDHFIQLLHVDEW